MRKLLFALLFLAAPVFGGVWNVNTPTGSDPINQGDDRIREMKSAVQEALQHSGVFPGTNPATAPMYQWTLAYGLNVNKPTTNLQDGQLYYSTDTYSLYKYNTDTSLWDIIAFSYPTGLNLSQYSRPVLVYNSSTTVCIENNTGIANNTQILFPDGVVRSVTEDTSSAHKYRKLDMNATAEFITGTEDSGLRSGITKTTDTWYSIYAVASQIDNTKFVMVADTVTANSSNTTILSGYYGTNKWVYLGMIRCGPGVETGTFDTGYTILSFIQIRNHTTFRLTTTNLTGTKIVGSYLGGGTGAIGTFSTTSGLTGVGIPSNLQTCMWLANFHLNTVSSGTHEEFVISPNNELSTWGYHRSIQVPVSSADYSMTFWAPTFDTIGFSLSGATVNSITYSFFMIGYEDNLLR